MSQETSEAQYFPNAPVKETILGVQFAPLPSLRSAHFGWFWTTLKDEWPRTNDVPALPSQYEVFGQNSTSDGPKISFRSAGGTERVQFIHRDDDQVLQIQNNRLILNWRKRRNEYPRFAQRLADFRTLVDRFKTFLADNNLGSIRPNQWEITYINQIPRGELWETPRDWHRIIPGLIPPWQGFENVCVESFEIEWHHEIESRRGRLHVALSKGANEESSDVLHWTQTARGAAAELNEVETGLECGHDAIVQSFLHTSSEHAREYWARKE
jgi:uncharacterized protein (TIGR04255 family)